mmetsp:Transcript_20836/g.38775  ORF Transcript_20836/g.38775 Transcript_20836/m.38775 type:complete len:516 (-) Transcript_20836:257-1804(-)|eukprot:CAMPEP_0184516898 /NCGR_PEP_ID=MMETSP0198_2-20121128/5274_1 /TAXON_ID=1112570 /ORGANISM="Thraustochytrium sp., Strain LLF1b" /LENGTH=515 /DNA_ID=CAMNT_0026907249 /DNA_START=46 /DNA_END=1593 /DNA_ORIENTATION=-
MATEQLQELTGLPESEAAQYLEMAGGDVGAAMELYFSLSAAGGAQDGPAGEGASAPQVEWPPSMEGTVLGLGEVLGEAWLKQGIECSEHSEEALGLVQAKNGPCGVLTVINAILLANRFAQHGKFGSDKFEQSEIVEALAQIVESSAGSSPTVQLCSWKDGSGPEGGVAVDPVNQGNTLRTVLRENYAMYTGAGAVVLLVLSCVETHGKDAVLQEIQQGGGEAPLIVGPNQLCTSELMKLMLCGTANGAIGAYSLMGGKIGPLTTLGGVGMLSATEKSSGIPLHDDLKSPKIPVWILHSGDHFTLLFRPDGGDPNQVPPFQLAHFNGLPPGGPRMTTFEVHGSEVSGKAPAEKKDSYVKPVVGEIEDVVQADSRDKAKNPKDYTKWKYEIVLAIDDPDVSGPERSDDAPPPVTFSLGEPPKEEWRCASCYRSRFQTMCFGQNPSGTDQCQYCGKSQKEAGWTLWLPYSELPTKWKSILTVRYAPAILNILQTKWPECEIKSQKSSRGNNSDVPSA